MKDSEFWYSVASAISPQAMPALNDAAQKTSFLAIPAMMTSRSETQSGGKVQFARRANLPV